LVDEFEVHPRADQRCGMTYPIKRCRGRASNRLDELAAKVAAHEKRLAALEAAPQY
jgi:hypothetical protein